LHVRRCQHQGHVTGGQPQQHRSRSVAVAQRADPADGAPIGVQLLGERDHTRPANDQPLREQGMVAAGFALRCGISVPYAR
jgi:hypothetical protein